MYSQYFKGLKKGEEWTCCCFCCHGTVLLALCFPVLHNKHKMQLLWRGKCGSSLQHLNTSWFLPLDAEQHALVVLSVLPPCLPRQGDIWHFPVSLGRAGAMQKHSGSPTWVALTAGASVKTNVFLETMMSSLYPAYCRHGMRPFQLNTCNAGSKKSEQDVICLNFRHHRVL